MAPVQTRIPATMSRTTGTSVYRSRLVENRRYGGLGDPLEPASVCFCCGLMGLVESIDWGVIKRWVEHSMVSGGG
jgi:hypothetical protein